MIVREHRRYMNTLDTLGERVATADGQRASGTDLRSIVGPKTQIDTPERA
jgi:hypothetical protein